MAEENKNTEDSKKVESKSTKGQYRCFLGCIYNVGHSNVLVAENIFTHNPILIESGTSFRPFNVVKEVVKASNVSIPGHFNEPMKASSKDGYDLGCFFSWTSTIVDPIKYVYATESPSKVLKALLLQGLKSYVKERNYETLSAKNFDINAKGAAEHLKNEFIAFENKYGIRISDIRLTDIIPPKELEEAYRQKAAQRSENERRLLEAKNRLEISEVNKEIAANEGIGKANALNEIKKSGLTPQEAAGYDAETRYADKVQSVYRFSGNTGANVSVIPQMEDKIKTK